MLYTNCMKISEIDLTALNNAHQNMDILIYEMDGNIITVPWTEKAEFFADHVKVNDFRIGLSYATDIYIVSRTIRLF